MDTVDLLIVAAFIFIAMIVMMGLMRSRHTKYVEYSGIYAYVDLLLDIVDGAKLKRPVKIWGDRASSTTYAGTLDVRGTVISEDDLMARSIFASTVGDSLTKEQHVFIDTLVNCKASTLFTIDSPESDYCEVFNLYYTVLGSTYLTKFKLT